MRHVDETGWREKTKRLWVWISVTPLVTIFRLLKTRGAAGAKEVVGEAVGHDRHGSLRQVSLDRSPPTPAVLGAFHPNAIDEWQFLSLGLTLAQKEGQCGAG